MQKKIIKNASNMRFKIEILQSDNTTLCTEKVCKKLCKKVCNQCDCGWKSMPVAFS